MGKGDLSHVDSWMLVLALISRLSGPKGQLNVECTTGRIRQDMKEIYERNLTRRQIENILMDLESRGFIFSKKGDLRDGRKVLHRINPAKVGLEIFTLIRIDKEKGYAHDGYEGIVFDPPRTEEKPRGTDNPGNLLFCGIALGLISLPLLLASLNQRQIAQRTKPRFESDLDFCPLLYDEETDNDEKTETASYADCFLYPLI